MRHLHHSADREYAIVVDAHRDGSLWIDIWSDRQWFEAMHRKMPTRRAAAHA